MIWASAHILEPPKNVYISHKNQVYIFWHKGLRLVFFSAPLAIIVIAIIAHEAL